MKITAASLRELCDPYGLDVELESRLECDGMSRILSFILYRAEIPHTLVSGNVLFGVSCLHHFWLEVPRPGKRVWTVDYRLGMWFGKLSPWPPPRGVFNRERYLEYCYLPAEVRSPVKSSLIFKILLQDFSIGRSGEMKG